VGNPVLGALLSAGDNNTVMRSVHVMYLVLLVTLPFHAFMVWCQVWVLYRQDADLVFLSHARPCIPSAPDSNCKECFSRAEIVTL
jgi:hypothetical protein